jgi:type IV secretion system protein VirB3
MEPLETDTLYLAATRPALFMGVPLTIGVGFMMLGGFIIVLLENPLYELVLIPLWLAARVLVARDYNAVGIAVLFLRTAGRSVDSIMWGGASVASLPIKVSKRGRGMCHAWE